MGGGGKKNYIEMLKYNFVFYKTVLQNMEETIVNQPILGTTLCFNFHQNSIIYFSVINITYPSY